jgi:hypothetical protein
VGLVLQLLLEAAKRDLQGPDAPRLEARDVELIVSRLFEDREVALGLDLQAVGDLVAQSLGRGFPDDAAKAGALVLEGEKDVAGGVALVVGDLADDPDLGETVLHGGLDPAREFPDGLRRFLLRFRNEPSVKWCHAALHTALPQEFQSS